MDDFTGQPRDVRIYLPEHLKPRAIAGELVFFNKLRKVLEKADFTVTYCDSKLTERLDAMQQPGFSIFHMKEPVDERGITIRPNYFYPFWNIQKNARRGDWPVAKAAFDPASIPEKDALFFGNYWRNRKFGENAQNPTRDGFVYVPLQGKIRAQRSFQFCSPIEMLKMLLEHEKSRRIIATLHPREEYTKADMAALEKFAKKHSRLTIESRDMAQMLARCDYVVSQNSSAAFFGYFFHKPAVLFGEIDFHHIAASVFDLGAEAAIKAAPTLSPDYDRYLLWFLKHMSIHIDQPDAESKITIALQNAGWPIDAL